MNFVCYRCLCSYCGPDIPPETCPRHSQGAIVGIGYGDMHYEVIDAALIRPEARLGWVSEDGQDALFEVAP